MPKFYIDRASTFTNPDAKPVDGAEKAIIKGERYDYTSWTIEVNSLEELMALQQKVDHPLIIHPVEYQGNLPTITIYDDYME